MKKISVFKKFRRLGKPLLYICFVTMSALSYAPIGDKFLPLLDDFLDSIGSDFAHYGSWIIIVFAGLAFAFSYEALYNWIYKRRIHQDLAANTEIAAKSPPTRSAIGTLVRGAGNKDSKALLKIIQDIYGDKTRSGDIEDIPATIDRMNQEIQKAAEEIAATSKNGNKSIADIVGESAQQDSQSIRTPLFATVVSGIVTARLSIASLALLVCFIAEWIAYSFELVHLTDGARFWFYGIAGIAVFDCLLAKMRQYTGAYGNRTIELLEVAAEVSKHIDKGSGPGSGTHFYVDDPHSKGTSLETAPGIQRGVVS